MKIDAQLGSLYPGKAAEMAKRMQAMGFDAVWSFEAGHDPFLPLMAAAMSTDKIQIGTNIAVAFGRSPFATAPAASILVWALRLGPISNAATPCRSNTRRRG
mgnify:CR=1 FL=1